MTQTQEKAGPDWRLSDFDFNLPEDRIASVAAEPRDSARLMHVKADGIEDLRVSDILSVLKPGDLLVMNDTKVIPARLYGKRGEVKVEILLHKKESDGTWLVLARPGKRLKQGDQIVFAPEFLAEVCEKKEGGEIRLRFNVQEGDFFGLLAKYGHVPLPPYIKRPEGDTLEDRDRYQTVYACHEGAVAAPTAGLHFTPELLERLVAAGHERVTLTLHVGAGTFLPVKAERIRDHVMHTEYAEISPEAAAKINQARREGRRIVAVGTTSVRTLETATDEAGVTHPFAGDTGIFIYPGYRFKGVDAMMTNFHLPKSTLFMLVSAFSGLDRMKAAYAHAISEAYRFYSYGDATFLEKDL